MRVWPLIVVVAAACSGEPSSTGQRTLERDPETAEAAMPATPRAQDGDIVEHTVTIGDPNSHYASVESIFPAGSGGSLEIMMPIWTPGSYLVREYPRNIDTLTAYQIDGTPLEVAKIRKNRWRIQTGGAARVVVRYKLYARELSVRTNFIDADIAVLNGAATFVTTASGAGVAHDIKLALPPSWRQSVTSLPPHPSGAAHHYLAATFDQLVDSPIVAGNPVVHTFEIGGVQHRLANFGEKLPDAPGISVWDGARSAADVEKIARLQTAFWGVIPYPRYVFINVMLGGGGGLEHLDSTLLLTDPWNGRKRDTYVEWLGLVSHEFLHTWNVKRLRPLELGPFDYENEVHTRSLWIAEGITSYYADLMLARAGLISEEEYLKSLSQAIESVQTSPGRHVQSLSMASFDAWIKHYRPSENSRNTTVSYYGKGSVVGFLLDAKLRQTTRGRRSLDDVMGLMYERYSDLAGRGYTPEQFIDAVDEVAGQPISDFLREAVDGTGELDYAPALAYYGLRFAAKPDDHPEQVSDHDKKPEQPTAWLGAKIADSSGVVTAVPRDTPAAAAGVNVEDELVAIDGYRVLPGNLGVRLEHYRPGDAATLTVTRHGALRDLQVVFAKEPDVAWNLEVDKSESNAQRNRRNSWLKIPATRPPLGG